MMFRLMLDVLSYFFQATLGYGKSSISLLPLKLAQCPALFVDEA